jgi:hypothetical protein
MLNGIALGAALMYILDPEQGKRRRARIHDAAAASSRDLVDGVATGWRDLRNRVRGALGAARGLTEEQPTDAVVEERVRARLGHFVRHSGLLDVNVQDGRVTLRGQLVATDVDELLRQLRRVHGVRSLEHELELMPDVPASAGDAMPRVARFDTDGRQRGFEWTPAARLLIGSSAGWLLLTGLGRRSLLGYGLSTVGMLTLARAFAERPAGAGDGAATRERDETFAAGGEAPTTRSQRETTSRRERETTPRA